jgi:putative flippase GtrA
MGGAAPRQPAKSSRAWRILGWALAVGLVVEWIVLLQAPGSIPWLFIVIATVAAVVLGTSVWSARPRGGPTP